MPIKSPKICQKGKVLNPITGRCNKIKNKPENIAKRGRPRKVPVKKITSPTSLSSSTSYYSALSNIEHIKDNKKKRVNKFNICPNDKEINIKTGRCVKKCKINQYRDFKTSICKSIPKAGRADRADRADKNGNDGKYLSLSYHSAVSKLTNSPNIVKNIEKLVTNNYMKNRSKFTRDIIKMSVLIANEKKNPNKYKLIYTPPMSLSK
jgi:hypothetical protein